ncbi:MAG: RdgB/HAM1 family non-canonical purine NTP pyrophosphatase [Myxococcota bacterium]
MRRLLLATRNEGKARELRELLSGVDVLFESLAGHPEAPDVEEHGGSFEANARLKATQVATSTGLWAIAEDSGLVVDKLGGEPGVRSARYAGVHGDAAANNAKLLRELEGEARRSARFVCVLALARPDGEIVATGHGTCEGTIAMEPKGSHGFGYDPLFIPERAPQLTMAELEPREKGLISHRGQAMRSFIPLLRVYLDDG